MKLAEVELPLRVRIRNFLRTHPDEFYTGGDLQKHLGSKSIENIGHYKEYSVKIGNIRYYTFTEKNRELLKRRLNGD